MKKRIIGITIIVIAIVICGITYFKHQENVKQENITNQVNELENIKTDFLNTEERDENSFYKFIRAVSSERGPDGPKRYHECRSRAWGQ